TNHARPKGLGWMNMRRTGDKGGKKTPAVRKLRDAKGTARSAQKSRPAASPSRKSAKQTNKAAQQPRSAKSSGGSGNSARSANTKQSGSPVAARRAGQSAANQTGKPAQRPRSAKSSGGSGYGARSANTKQSRSPEAARHAGKSAAQDTGHTTSDESQATSLAADCTIAEAGDIKSRLARVLTKEAPVIVDLSEVRRIDTAGLQVLAAFIRERRAAGREVHCEGATESFQVTASLLGLGALFNPVMDERLSGPAAGNA
ncbi:MAG: STAS domain-containing protein, partial [Gammaproteobacteria bacterium]